MTKIAVMLHERREKIAVKRLLKAVNPDPFML